MSNTDTIYIIAGGTFVDVAPHFSFAARAYGSIGVKLYETLVDIIEEQGQEENIRVIPIFTGMAGGQMMRLAHSGVTDAANDVSEGYRIVEKVLGGSISTNDDLAKVVAHLRDQGPRAIILASAVCDFEPSGIEQRPDEDWMTSVLGDKAASKIRSVWRDVEQTFRDEFGRNTERLKTRSTEGGPQPYTLNIKPTRKLIADIRRGPNARKDVFVVGFKTTAGATEDEQYFAGLNMLKSNSINLVLANDIDTKVNMVITPEEARYHVGPRETAIEGLCEMILSRSKLRFTRSEVVGSDSDLIKWEDERIPDNLRKVVDWCIEHGAYKPFRGKTVGHFAVKLGDNEFATSLRHTNFNTDLHERGMSRVITVDDTRVIAFGAKPSVGGQSQRAIFRDHPDTDCIVHFHCPPKPGSEIKRGVEQRPYECGSHECGENTSRNLRDYGDGIKAVYLEEHGPNIVFSKNTSPEVVIDFIARNFDLSDKTGGLLSEVA